MECPCVGCICVAICRLKTFRQLVGDCELVVDYADKTVVTHPFYRISIRDVLDPVLWDVNDTDGYFCKSLGNK